MYRYFFTEVPDAPASSVYGAVHGLELLYVFGVLDIKGYSPTAAERALSTSMQAYWGGLAANGTPSAVGAPAWTPYDPNRDTHLVLDAAALAMGEGVNTTRCDFWSTFGLQEPHRDGTCTAPLRGCSLRDVMELPDPAAAAGNVASVRCDGDGCWDTRGMECRRHRFEPWPRGCWESDVERSAFGCAAASSIRAGTNR